MTVKARHLPVGPQGADIIRERDQGDFHAVGFQLIQKAQEIVPLLARRLGEALLEKLGRPLGSQLWIVVRGGRPGVRVDLVEQVLVPARISGRGRPAEVGHQVVKKFVVVFLVLKQKKGPGQDVESGGFLPQVEARHPADIGFGVIDEIIHAVDHELRDADALFVKLVEIIIVFRPLPPVCFLENLLSQAAFQVSRNDALERP